ncbi:MAG TPA: hypothetical protein VF285_11835 [Castellaniella sp.]|uniref:hypothetical protein n=1 Tax=Castellaniella sp. TaxID=1955812 RepID=UPI002EDE0705
MKERLRPYLTTERFLAFLAFAIPLFYFAQIDLVGKLYLNEVFYLLLLPFLFYFRSSLMHRKILLLVLLALAVWLLAQVATDVIRHTAFHDYARGWAKILFTATNLCAMYLIVYRSRRRLVLLSYGLALGTLLHAFVTDDPTLRGTPWQLGYGWGVSWLIVAAGVTFAASSHYKLRHWIPVACAALASALNFYMGYRSMGGILFISTCYLTLQCLQPRPARQSPGLRRIALLCVFGILAATAALKTYEGLALHGWLGSYEQTRVTDQSDGAYGLLLGGRFEIIVSSQAIAKSPWIGHGSWATDCHYRDLYDQLKHAAGYIGGEWGSCVIPSHSYLMSAWVDAGILGALVWLVFAGLAIRALLSVHVQRDKLTPLVIFGSLWTLWNIAFSPFAGEARFTFPFFLILMLMHLPNPRVAWRTLLTSRPKP